MPRMRVIQHKCAACQHYKQEGIVCRCYTPSNVYTNWLGNIFKEPPSKKNYNGRCKDYEEINDHADGSDDDVDGRVQTGT